MNSEDALWRYFNEVNAAVRAANQGDGSQPFKRGTFIVTALSGDIELSVKDISEEDAVLIAAELKEMDVKANISATLVCGSCGVRVPEQAYCVNCRVKLPDVQ